jgi:hypothetical protein
MHVHRLGRTHTGNCGIAGEYDCLIIANVARTNVEKMIAGPGAALAIEVSRRTKTEAENTLSMPLLKTEDVRRRSIPNIEQRQLRKNRIREAAESR